jgi:hypothetical protein
MELEWKTRFVQVTLSKQPGYLLFTVTGAYDFEDFRTIVQAARDECIRSGANQALVDIRIVTGDIPNLERYSLGVLFAQTWTGRLRAGILAPGDRINKFFENTAVNRYAQVIVHAEEAVVLEWLETQ